MTLVLSWSPYIWSLTKLGYGVPEKGLGSDVERNSVVKGLRPLAVSFHEKIQTSLSVSKLITPIHTTKNKISGTRFILKLV